MLVIEGFVHFYLTIIIIGIKGLVVCVGIITVVVISIVVVIEVRNCFLFGHCLVIAIVYLAIRSNNFSYIVIIIMAIIIINVIVIGYKEIIALY